MGTSATTTSSTKTINDLVDGGLLDPFSVMLWHVGMRLAPMSWTINETCWLACCSKALESMLDCLVLNNELLGTQMDWTI